MNTRRFRRRIARLVRAVVISIVIALVLCEVGLRLVVVRTAETEPVDYRILPSPPPAPYLNAPYWNSEFWYERALSQSGWTYRDNGLVIRPEFHSIYYNTRGNYRVTTDQPANARHTIWLVGSSTVFDSDVPDAYTKASYLQRLVGPQYRVEQRGVSSITADKEVLLLRELPVQPGDMVVFYDGAMDMLSTYRITQNRQRLQPSVCNFLRDHVGWSVLVQASCLILQNRTIAPDPALIERMRKDYTQALIEARAYTRSRGATFYHVLQPTIFSQAPNAYERTIALDPGLADVYAATWPILQAEPDTIDLTHSLDALRGTGAAIYFDYAHTNERGHAAIARAIAERVSPTF